MASRSSYMAKIKGSICSYQFKIYFIIQGSTKVYTCEYIKHSLFLYCALIIVLFSIQTAVNLLFSQPIYFLACVYMREDPKNHNYLL